MPKTEKNDKLEIHSISNQLENEKNKMESLIIEETINLDKRNRKSMQRSKKVSFSRFKQIQSNSLSITNYPIDDEIVINCDDSWSQMDENEKITFLVFSILKIFTIILLTYAFMVLLGLLSNGVILISNSELKSSSIINFLSSNSLNSLALAIVLTALLQNVTVVLSILIVMISSGIMETHIFAPFMMGAHIGSCIKAIILSSSFQNISEFRRSFRSAALNHGFHLITTLVILPFEIGLGFMLRLSEFFIETTKIDQINFFNDIINPFLETFIILDAKVARKCCGTQFKRYLKNSSLVHFKEDYVMECSRKCNYICMPMVEYFGDTKTGIILMIVSIFLMYLCLFSIFKMFSSFISGPLAKWTISGLNSFLSLKFKWVCHLLLFACSTFLGAFLQNSNSLTSTLANLYQIKIISLQGAYVMTLGSNIGGATSAFYLLAFIQTSPYRSKVLQLALINSLYILLGTLFWLPLSNLRFPKIYAAFFSSLVYKYKWGCAFYALLFFLIGPFFILGLALFKPYWIRLIIVGLIALSILIVFFAKKCLYLKFIRVLYENFYHKFINKSEDRQVLDVSLVNYINKETSIADIKCRILLFFQKMAIMSDLVRKAKQFSEKNISEYRFSDESSDEELFCNEFCSRENTQGLYIFSNSSFRKIRDVISSTPNRNFN
jgi:solute carrier family 34 (sodium-dependent phosphate cotransporter)